MVDIRSLIVFVNLILHSTVHILLLYLNDDDELPSLNPIYNYNKFSFFHFDQRHPKWIAKNCAMGMVDAENGPWIVSMVCIFGDD